MSKLVPPVCITLDRPRHVVCDMAAVALIHEWTGVDILDRKSAKEAEDAKVFAQPKNVNATLAALLAHEDPDITPREAGRLLNTLEKVSAASSAVAEAIGRFFGVSSEQLKAVMEEMQTGTNDSPSPVSGPSVDTTSD